MGQKRARPRKGRARRAAFHSLRHVKRFAKEACRALDAAEAAHRWRRRPRPRMTAALRR